MPTSAQNTYTKNRLIPAIAGLPAPTASIKLPASKTLYAGQVLGELIGNNEVQTLTEGTNITAGTFTITFGGQTTAAIAWDATAAQVQAALEALSTIGVGNIAVTGMSGGLTAAPATLTFQNALGYTNVAQVTVDVTSLTGTITVATATAGSAGTPGTFDVVDLTATSGLQLPKAILEWDTVTDSNGKVVMENGRTVERCSAYIGGAFNTADLTGCTAAVIAARPGARLLQGTLASGTTGIVQW